MNNNTQGTFLYPGNQGRIAAGIVNLAWIAKKHNKNYNSGGVIK